jgi:hypothetical protein
MDREPRWKEPPQVDSSADPDMAEPDVVARQHGARVGWLRRFSWRATVVLGAALSLAALRMTRHAAPDARPPVGGVWNVELSSAGTEPVTALAYGSEAGLHLVRVPGRNAPADERRRIPVRLSAGNVYLVSLGWHDLNLSTRSPAGAPPMRLTAHARFVTLFQSPGETGVRTSWRGAA